MVEKISGIYRIVCVKNGRYYYGSSKNIHLRWLRHKRALRKNVHDNPIVQRVWNKHGEDTFRVELIKKVPKDRLLEVENVYLKEHVGKSNCMNIAKDAFAPMLGRKLDPKRRGWIANWWKSNKVARQQQSSLMKLRAKDPEYKKELLRRSKIGVQRAALARQKTYSGFISPNGKVYEDVVNLNEFCRTHGLDNRLLHMVDKEKRKRHRGWTKLSRDNEHG